MIDQVLILYLLYLQTFKSMYLLYSPCESQAETLQSAMLPCLIDVHGDGDFP